MSQPQQPRLQRPVGRFAPSPTGPLHFGSLVAAVGSWLFARSSGGRWLMRMEDLDQSRVIPGMADDILRTLEELGMEWDGPVIFQSSRAQHYDAALDTLKKAGHVYSCGCSRADLARSASAPHQGEDGPAYPGTCRHGLTEGKGERALRVRVPDELITFSDAVMGHYQQNPARFCGDFVVQRKDGPVAYQFAVVVDDAEMGVSQVVRGADLLSSTPRQIWLQQLLGLSTPEYAHVPLVTGHDGTKLSKRDNVIAAILNDAQRISTVARALTFLGQPLPDRHAEYSCKELLEWGRIHFDVSRIPRRSRPLSSCPDADDDLL